MARKGAHANAKTLHRCRIVLNIRCHDENERSFSLGPGSVITDDEYEHLMDRKYATPDMFEDVGAEPVGEESEE